MEFHEEAFKAAAQITAAVAEEAEVELNAEGADQAAAFFAVLYKKLLAIAMGEEETARKPGNFEVYQDSKGKYRFRLKAANGQTVAVSQAYQKKGSCLNGIESIRACAPDAKIEELSE